MSNRIPASQVPFSASMFEQRQQQSATAAPCNQQQHPNNNHPTEDDDWEWDPFFGPPTKRKKQKKQPLASTQDTVCAKTEQFDYNVLEAAGGVGGSATSRKTVTRVSVQHEQQVQKHRTINADDDDRQRIHDDDVSLVSMSERTVIDTKSSSPGAGGGNGEPSSFAPTATKSSWSVWDYLPVFGWNSTKGKGRPKFSLDSGNSKANNDSATSSENVASSHLSNDEDGTNPSKNSLSRSGKDAPILQELSRSAKKVSTADKRYTAGKSHDKQSLLP